MNLVKKVGGTRILHELVQILDEPQVVSALRRLEQFDLLKFIDPRLTFDQSSAQLLVAAERSSNWFDLLYTGEDYLRWLLYLGCLIDPLTARGVERVCKVLDLRPKHQDILLRQMSDGRLALKTALRRASGKNRVKKSEIYHWFQGLSLEVVLFLMARTQDERVRKWISQFVTGLRKEQVLLNGKDLIALGLRPGKYFNQVFMVLLEARLDGEIFSREDEIALVKQRFLPAG